MPLVLEDDARSANSFDPASASTLYWKQVPVLVKQHDREDQTEQLTFRILSGVTRQNHSLRVSLAIQNLSLATQPELPAAVHLPLPLLVESCPAHSSGGQRHARLAAGQRVQLSCTAC